MIQGTDTVADSDADPCTAYSTPARIRAFYGLMVCLCVVVTALVTVAAQHVALPDVHLAKFAHTAAYVAAYASAIAYIAFYMALIAAANLVVLYVWLSVSLSRPTPCENNRRTRIDDGASVAAIPFLFVACVAVVAGTAPDVLGQGPFPEPLWVVWVATAALFAVPGVVTAAKAWLIPETDEQARIEKQRRRAGRR